jgi:steroid 5-alpha reductase family enzyme
MALSLAPPDAPAVSSPIGQAAVLCLGLMAALWCWQRRTKHAAIVDAGWAAAIGLAALLYAATGEGHATQRACAGLVAGLWSSRLTWHLLRDRVLGRPEDGRYAAMRAAWGDRADLHFVWFFAAQALLAWGLSLPFWLLAQHGAASLSLLQWSGLAVFALALAGESLADRQLAGFRADPANRGQVCAGGLWRYSRHPNYFCEWLVWVAIAMLVHEAPHGAWGWLAAAVMFVFITKLTGIPYTEAQALRSRGARYAEYQRTTSAFVPWPPRQAGGA